MDRTQAAGTGMSSISTEEIEARHTLAKRYEDSQKKAIIDEKVRGIRQAINLLIAEERKLIAESESLRPTRCKA